MSKPTGVTRRSSVLPSGDDGARVRATLVAMHLMAPCEALAPPGSKARSKRPADANSLTSPHKCKPVTAVAKFDRLCRSVADPAQVMVDFDRMDIKLIAIVERFDMANSAGRWRRWPMCLPT